LVVRDRMGGGDDADEVDWGGRRCSYLAVEADV